MDDRLIATRVTEIERALVRALEREGASSEHGCSALANVLLEALVRARKDPLIRANVENEMRRLAVKILDLAGGDVGTLERRLADTRMN